MKIKIIDSGSCTNLTYGRVYEVLHVGDCGGAYWRITDDVGESYPVYKNKDIDGIVAVEVTSELHTPVTVTTKTTLEIQSGPFDEVFINGDKYVLDKQ